MWWSTAASPRCEASAVSDYPSFIPNLIGGADCPAASGDQVEVLSPHSGQAIGKLARSGEADVAAAIASARARQPAWAATPGVRRGEILHAVANALEAHRQELAEIVAWEAGKRMSDDLGEA